MAKVRSLKTRRKIFPSWDVFLLQEQALLLWVTQKSCSQGGSSQEGSRQDEKEVRKMAGVFPTAAGAAGTVPDQLIAC